MLDVSASPLTTAFNLAIYALGALHLLRIGVRIALMLSAALREDFIATRKDIGLEAESWRASWVLHLPQADARFDSTTKGVGNRATASSDQEIQ